MKYIYLHIPKNGGSTLHQIIDEQYHSNAIYNVNLFDREKSREEFIALNEAEKNKIQVLKGGHIEHGWHQYFTTPSEIKYFTILRDPIERALSFYYYAKRTPAHYLYKKIKEENISLEDFLENEKLTKEISNGQAKMIAGVEQKEMCTEELYQKALTNLESQFFLVGLIEQYEETLFLLKENLKWKKPINYKIVNENQSKDYNITDSIRQKLEEINHYDIAIYNKYKAIFNEKLNKYNDTDITEFKSALAAIKDIKLRKLKNASLLKRIINKIKQ